MGICAINCGDNTIIANPQATCSSDLRKTTPSRMFFFLCNVTLPNPITNINIKALFDSGDIVASMPLSNIVWNDPTYEDVQKDDCTPPDRIVVSREMTFEDKYGVIDTASPSSGEYLDYDFWQDKIDKTQRLYYMIGYCGGDVKIGYNTDGTLMNASLTLSLNYQKPQTAGNASIEFKKGSFVFAGDPLNLKNKPAFNYIDAGIVL